MKDTVLIIGGCRSGKSRHALELAMDVSAKQNIYIATCLPRDEEMDARVRRHQQERGQSWITVEAPLRISEALNEHGRRGNVIVLDCLTLWLSNLMLGNETGQDLETRIQELLQSLDTVVCPVFVVSNEVGTGIVPENRLARQFRDLAGFTNQKMAARADRVIWMVAGIPISIKQRKT